MRVRSYLATAFIFIFITSAAPTHGAPKSVKRQPRITQIINRLRQFVTKGLGDHLSPPLPEPTDPTSTTPTTEPTLLPCTTTACP
jgi:hypothetical protein